MPGVAAGCPSLGGDPLKLGSEERSLAGGTSRAGFVDGAGALGFETAGQGWDRVETRASVTQAPPQGWSWGIHSPLPPLSQSQP